VDQGAVTDAPPFWRGKRVLLTGHTGFKGAWAALWLHHLGAEVTGLALAAEPLSLYRLLRLDELIASHVVDLRDTNAVAAVVAEARPQLVLHMAAQPLVNRGLVAPVETFAVNTLGTVHLLDALRTVANLAAVLVVTTDKVYANDESGRACRESDRLGGHDPYSASKAACEIATAAMAACFMTSRGIPVATARGGNVIGGGDFAPDRLVPDIVRSARSGQNLILRNPQSIRPWQHVLDCLCGYLTYLAALAAGQTLPHSLNFGPSPDQTATVGALADAMLDALGFGSRWVHTPDPLSHEARTLVLDSQLARRTLGWRDRLADRQMIAATASWYRAWADHRDMRAFTLAQIADYETLP
jgi:CDP-glucose 4,6-dehydratase